MLQIFLYHPASFDQLHGGRRTRWQEFKRIDHFGLLLLVAGLTLFLLGVSWGGNPQPWTSSLILGLIISGGLTLVIFVFYEAWTPSPNPIVDLTLFKDVRGYLCLNIVAMAAGAMYIALSVIWPQRK
jgi:RsiW-degrading membrane proteinase PrsW (M82 family)